MSFIELHSNSNKNKISYNINHIVKFYEPEEKMVVLFLQMMVIRKK